MRALAAAARATSARVRLSLATGGRRDARPSSAGSSSPGASSPPAATSLTGNPANSFFYLLTGLHGLHILGGLVALGARRPARLGRGRRRGSSGFGVELCATYWHFLLLVWLGLFVLLHRLGEPTSSTSAAQLLT